MYLARLEMFGFKSFAERIELQFGPGITAIVGPNGSGKSNVADAVRWVLGEQSAKTLRGGKMEDVIFSGTEKKKPLSFCEVTLVFNNDDHSLLLDYSEIAVTRRLYRSGESEYAINRTPCRLKDIVELFLDTGIGKEGYSIIGQGKIDSIISVKTEERRAVFEEAAGIAKFKSKKNEAERRLQHTRENLQRLCDILFELENHLGPLSEQAKVAAEYLSLWEALRKLEVNFYLYQHDFADKRKNQARESMQALEEERAEKEGWLAQMEQNGQTREEELAKLEGRLETLRTDILRLATELEQGAGEQRLLVERIARCEQDAARAKTERDDRDRLETALQARLQGDREEAARQRASLRGRQAALTAQEEELQQTSRQLEAEEQVLETERQQVFARLNSLSDVKTNLGRYQAMVSGLEERLGTLQSMREKALLEKENISQALVALRGEADQKKAALRQAQQQAETERALGLQLEQKLEGQRQLAQADKVKLSNAQSRRSILTDMKRDYEGYAYSVKQLLSFCEKSPPHKALCGGAVAGLITVPQRLEKAVEMALGPSLQHLVTPDEEAAKTLIRLLREKNFGRATFLPLTAIRGRVLTGSERNFLSAPGCLGIAAELIEYNPAHKEIIHNLLGRTVICEGLDAAVALARRAGHAFKVVTLEGDIVNAGGSMTGGSAGKLTSLLGRDRELERAESDVAFLTQQIAEAEASLQKLAGEKAQKLARAEELFRAAREQELLRVREEERVNKLAGELERAEGALEQLDAERVQMEETRGELQEQISRANSAQGSMEENGAQEQAQLAARAAALGKRKLERDKLRETLTEEKIHLAGLEKELSALEGNAMRTQAELSGGEQRRAELLAKAEEFLREAERLRAEEQNLLQATQAKKQARAQLEEELAACTARRESLQGERRGEEARKKEVEAALTASREKTFRLEMTLQKIDSDISALEQRIWDEYQLTYALAADFREEGFAPSGAAGEISRRKKEIAALGPVNVQALEEYAASKERFHNLTAQKQDLDKAEADLQKIIADLSNKMDKQFREQFQLINKYFAITFKELFGGGRAELRLEEGDALECGIEIVAQPPGKTLQLLSLLSGGERALTAVAILFAMLRLKPSPFCLLDEVETALDDANTYNLAEYLRKYADNTQFLIITHKKPTMEQADRLYGIAMEEKGVSRMVTVKMADF